MLNSLLEVQKSTPQKSFPEKILCTHRLQFWKPCRENVAGSWEICYSNSAKNLRLYFFPRKSPSKLCTVHSKTVLTTHLENLTKIRKFFVQSIKTRRKLLKFQLKQLWLKRCSLQGVSNFDVLAAIFLPKNTKILRRKSGKKLIWLMFAEQKSSLKSPSVHLKCTFGKLDDNFSRNAGKVLLRVQ